MDDLGPYEVRRCDDPTGSGHDQGKGSGTSYPVDGEAPAVPQPQQNGGNDVGKGSGSTSYPVEGE